MDSTQTTQRSYHRTHLGQTPEYRVKGSSLFVWFEPRSQLTSSKFIMDTTLHSAFRDARAETRLPSAPDLPPPFVKRRSDGQAPESVPSIIAPNDTRHDSISSIITTNSTRWRDSISSSSIELQRSRPVPAYRRIGYQTTPMQSGEYCI